jgi:hypothetical protein
MSNPTADRIKLERIESEKHPSSKYKETPMGLERLRETMTYLYSNIIEYGGHWRGTRI